MELYRRLVTCEALKQEAVKYIKIGHKEYKADEVLKALKVIGFKKVTDCREVDGRIADALVACGVLLKSIGGRPCYRPVKGKFLAFYQEFLDDYWEEESILSEDDPMDDFEDDPMLDWLDELDPIACLTLLSPSKSDSPNKKKTSYHSNNLA